jgi:hypothetical protein
MFSLFIPFFLLPIILLARENHLLLIGDSVDRNAQHSWCASYNDNVEKAQIDWGDKTIKYGGHYGILHSPALCVNPKTNDSIAAVHIYGSNPEQSYFQSWEAVTPLVGNIHNTTYRIQTMLQAYFQRFDRNPTAIMINTILWDLHGESQHAFNIEHFRQNLLFLISLVRKSMGCKVNVGFRTAPTGIDNYFRANILNEIIRDVFEQGHSSIIYDYDKDMWSTLNFVRDQDNHALLFNGSKTEHHPNDFFRRNAAEKMLHTSYSSYYAMNHSNLSVKWFALAAINNSNFNINFMRSENNVYDTYYTKIEGNKRYKWKVNISELSLGRWMHVSKGDFLSVPIKILDFFPTFNMPPFFDGNLRGVVTKSQNMFLIRWSEHFLVFQVAHITTFSLFHVEQSNLLTDIDDFWFNEMHIEQMADLYADGTLLKLHACKQVYIVSNFTKKTVRSMDVIYAKGLDLEKVKIIKYSYLLDILPDGGELM